MNPQVIATTALEFDGFERTPNVNTGPTPLLLKTYVLPVSVRYFASAGTALRLGVNHVRQSVDRLAQFADNAGKDTFTTLDGEIAWRLPQGRGSISLQGRNLTGTRFRFIDDSFRKPSPEVPRFTPSRSLFATVSLAL